jgi:integrase/recombinase XerD
MQLTHTRLLENHADNDDQIITLWLHGRSPATVRLYARDAADLVAKCGQLRSITLGALQAWADNLPGADRSRGVHLAAARSLLSFAYRLGYTSFNVGAAMRAIRSKQTLTERILQESDVLRMLALEEHPRNRALLYLLYDTGARVSEVLALKWCDIHEDGDWTTVTLVGKGLRTRHSHLTATTHALIDALRPSEGANDEPVFESRQQHRAISVMTAERIVRAAAVRAGIDAPASPHWLRHAHATHALRHGADIKEVADQLGHASIVTTATYLHVAIGQSTSRFLNI